MLTMHLTASIFHINELYMCVMCTIYKMIGKSSFLINMSKADNINMKFFFSINVYKIKLIFSGTNFL